MIFLDFIGYEIRDTIRNTIIGKASKKSLFRLQPKHVTCYTLLECRYKQILASWIFNKKKFLSKKTHCPR